MKQVSCDYLLNIANDLILVRAGTSVQQALLVSSENGELVYCTKDLIYEEHFHELIKDIVSHDLHLVKTMILGTTGSLAEVRIYSKRVEYAVQD